MSVPLPAIDMSQYVATQGSYITLDRAKQTQPSSTAHSTEKAHIRVFNDSGSHLRVWMDTGDLNEYLPAGGWLTWDIDQTANEFHWAVINVLPNPPIQLMLITYYKQGEIVPEIPQLGNSPIGGAVQATGAGVVTADHLINTGNAGSSSPIVQVRQSGATGDNLNADNQGNLLVQDYVSSVLTTILRVIAGGAPGSVDLLLGDTNRQVQVNGQMHTRSRLWADSEITISDSTVGSGGGANVVTNITMFNNNDRGIEVLPNSGITGFTGVQVDSSGVNNTGTGFVAAAVQLGMWLSGCYGGIKIDGLAPNGGVDMTGMAAGSGPSILTGPNPVALQAGSNANASGNGSVSGSLNLWCPVWGRALKICVFELINFQTASNVNVAFPSAFSNKGMVWTGDMAASTFSMLTAGVAQTCRQIVYGAAGVAGTTSAQTVLRAANQYAFLSSADSFQCQTTGGATINNSGFIVGI